MQWGLGALILKALVICMKKRSFCSKTEWVKCRSLCPLCYCSLCMENSNTGKFLGHSQQGRSEKKRELNARNIFHCFRELPKMAEPAGFELIWAPFWPSNLECLEIININIFRDDLRNQESRKKSRDFPVDSYKDTISIRVQGKLKETSARQKEWFILASKPMEKKNQLGAALLNLNVLISFVEKHIGIKSKMKYNCNISQTLMPE